MITTDKLQTLLFRETGTIKNKPNHPKSFVLILWQNFSAKIFFFYVVRGNVVIS